MQSPLAIASSGMEFAALLDSDEAQDLGAPIRDICNSTPDGTPRIPYSYNCNGLDTSSSPRTLNIFDQQAMIPPENSDGFWSGDFSSDGSHHTDDGRHLYNTFGDPTANPYIGPTLEDELANRYPNDLSGAASPSSPIDEYGLHFGTHPPIDAPLSPAFLPFGDIVHLSLFANEGLSTQEYPAPTLGSSGPNQPTGSTPMQIPTSTLDHTDHIPFEAPQMSASLPYSLHSSQTPMYPDVHRARSGSYAGPTQTPYHHSVHPSAFHTASDLGFGRTFQVEFQDLANEPERLGSPSNGPTQHIIDFDFDSAGYQHAGPPPTIQPSSIPLPASPSEESSSSPSPTHSPATSTSSLTALPPSPSTSRGETFRWRLNSQESPAWRCDCKSNAKKKKRHLESCPRNPDKPKIKCPCCDQIFVGGSRKSALKKHMLNFHKDQLDRLKKHKG
ncbi:hypothetical protein FRC05_009226 [Tulasnella sp. 425]|nr:hypothetical protein FRC05_009226 [Tulasnella sp. 425]